MNIINMFSAQSMMLLPIIIIAVIAVVIIVEAISVFVIMKKKKSKPAPTQGEVDAAINNIKRRSVIVSFLLCCVTGCIYLFYWIYKITNDSNAISDKIGNGHRTASGGKAILFMFLTFGMYNWYWAYKTAKKLESNGFVFLLFSFVGAQIINLALAQREINLFYDEMKKTESVLSANRQSKQGDDIDYEHPFTAVDKTEFLKSGVPAEIYDYMCTLKQGDMLLDMLNEQDKVIRWSGQGVSGEFLYSGLLPRIKDGKAEIYVIMKALTERLRSASEKWLFKADKNADGYTVLHVITDEKLFAEIMASTKTVVDNIQKASESK